MNQKEHVSPVGEKHREFGNFAKTRKTQGIWLAQVQVVNSLILKVKDIVYICRENFQSVFEAGKVCQVSFVYLKVTNHVNWHREFCGRAEKT